MKKYIIIILLFSACVYSKNCSYTFDKEYLHDHILIFYLDYFGSDNLSSQVDLFRYKMTRSSECNNETINIEFSFNIFSPDLGFTNFEMFYQGNLAITIDEPIEFFTNSDFSFSSGLSNDNEQTKQLISYISQSGSLPSGQYLFQFTIKRDNNIIETFSDFIDINKPSFIDLLSPGGKLSNLSSSVIYNKAPLFTWYSDYCPECTYEIRICEYNQNIHKSLQEALNDRSIIPWNQFDEFYTLPKNAHSFQYPYTGFIDLQEGQYYVWQVRRSYETTLVSHYDYSSIYIFEIQSPTKNQIDFSDPYLSLVKSLIGKEQFDLLFSTGGELERYVTSGNSVWINEEEFHIDILYLLNTDFNQGKIKINNIEIK